MLTESRFNVWVSDNDEAYVFNGVSGGLLHMPAGLALRVRQFLDGVDCDCPSKVLESMALGRMIVSDGFDEVSALALRYGLAVNDQSQLDLTILTTLDCNFACPYCYESKRAGPMSNAVASQVLRLVDDQLPTIGKLHVTWFGGEPLVGRRALFRLSEALTERTARAGVEYSAAIVTNGYLLDDRTCKRLHDCGVSRVQITLDGPPEMHDLRRPLRNGAGTFERIVRNLEQAVTYFDVHVRINLDSDDLEPLAALLQILDQHGLRDKLIVYPGRLTVDDDRDRSSAGCGSCLSTGHFEEVERQALKLCASYGYGSVSLPAPKGAACMAVRKNGAVIGPDGSLYKCLHVVGNPAHVVGQVSAYRQADSRLRRWLEYSPFDDAECVTCRALPYCMGGCPYYGLEGRREDRCQTVKETLEQQILDFVRSAPPKT